MRNMWRHFDRVSSEYIKYGLHYSQPDAYIHLTLFDSYRIAFSVGKCTNHKQRYFWIFEEYSHGVWFGLFGIIFIIGTYTLVTHPVYDIKTNTKTTSQHTQEIAEKHDADIRQHVQEVEAQRDTNDTQEIDEEFTRFFEEYCIEEIVPHLAQIVEYFCETYSQRYHAL